MPLKIKEFIIQSNLLDLDLYDNIIQLHSKI